eukprot:s1951_g3.t1
MDITFMSSLTCSSFAKKAPSGGFCPLEIARHRLTPTPASDTAKLHKPFWAQAAKKPVEDVHVDGSIMSCYLCLRRMS